MPSLFRYALGRLGRAEEAEEVVNQTFEEAWKGIPRYEDRGLPLRAWLFGIARNIVSRHRRRFMSRNAQVSLDTFEVEPTAEAEDPRLVEIAIAMSQIDQRHAEVLSLRYLHGLSARETAAVMKIGEEAVKSRQRRALEALRTRLDGGS
jgi:RNA polymerase sigma-70 factor (ECF subfamily)